jgi:hypothetical protein
MFLFPRGKLLQEVWAEEQSQRERLTAPLVCAITREILLGDAGSPSGAKDSAPLVAVLASDGQLYDLEALRTWAGKCIRAGRPPTSPVTREVLRPWARKVVRRVVRIASGPGVSGIASGPGEAVVRFHSFAPPFSLHTPRIGGVVQMSEWDDRPGVLARMLLGWEDGDALEWQLPLSGSSPPVPATPPPCLALLPLLPPILRWWSGMREGGDGNNSALSRLALPGHLLTAPIRVVTPEGAQPWTTMEEALLALNDCMR